MPLFSLPRLYAIIDTTTLAVRDLSPAVVAGELLQAGVRILQYRHKSAFTRKEFAEAKLIAELCRQSGVPFVMNDRADLARLLNAGLHVGQDDLLPGDARKVLEAGAIVGFSTHNALQLEKAAVDPIDYAAIGPVFPTGSKENPDPVVGLEALPALRALTTMPLVAIGGITLDNASRVLNTGVDSLAVITGLLPASHAPGEVKRRAEEWLRVLSMV